MRKADNIRIISEMNSEDNKSHFDFYRAGLKDKVNR